MPVSSNACRMSPSKRPTVGKFCTPAKPSVLSSSRKSRGMMNGIRAVHAGEDGRPLDDRQDLIGHFLDDLVGVAVGEQPRRACRAPPSGSGRSCRRSAGRCRRASSLFADRPVPAPPPMIGSPRAICSRKRLRMACGSCRLRLGHVNVRVQLSEVTEYRISKTEQRSNGANEEPLRSLRILRFSVLRCFV